MVSDCRGAIISQRGFNHITQWQHIVRMCTNSRPGGIEFEVAEESFCRSVHRRVRAPSRTSQRHYEATLARSSNARPSIGVTRVTSLPSARPTLRRPLARRPKMPCGRSSSLRNLRRRRRRRRRPPLQQQQPEVARQPPCLSRLLLIRPLLEQPYHNRHHRAHPHHCSVVQGRRLLPRLLFRRVVRRAHHRCSADHRCPHRLSVRRQSLPAPTATFHYKPRVVQAAVVPRLSSPVHCGSPRA